MIATTFNEIGSTVVQLIWAGIDGAGVIETELLIWPDCTFKAVASIKLLTPIISDELPGSC